MNLTISAEKLEASYATTADENNESINNDVDSATTSQRQTAKPSKNIYKDLPRNVYVNHLNAETPPQIPESSESVFMSFVEADIRCCPPPLLEDDPYSLPAVDPRGNADYDRIVDETNEAADRFLVDELSYARGESCRPTPSTSRAPCEQSVSDHRIVEQLLFSMENAEPVEKTVTKEGNGDVDDEASIVKSPEAATNASVDAKSGISDVADMLNAFLVQDQIMNESNSIF